MTRSRRLYAGLWLVLAAALVALQVFVGAPDKSLLWTTLFDAGHTPLFAVLTVALLQAAFVLLVPAGLARRWCYPIAFGIAMGLAALTEVIQMAGPRDADAWDLLRNLLGAAAGLLIFYAFDRDRSGRGRHLRLGLILVAVALVAYALLPLGRLVPALIGRQAAFPALCEFSEAWEKTFVLGRDADLEIVPAPAGWDHPPRGNERRPLVGHLTYRPADYPALHLKEPYPDWTDYDRLVFEVFSELPEPVDLILRIDDERWAINHRDAFNRVLTIHPGAQKFVIATSDIRDGPRDRPLNLKRIHNLILFANRPQQPFSIYVDSFRLERN